MPTSARPNAAPDHLPGGFYRARSPAVRPPAPNQHQSRTLSGHPHGERFTLIAKSKLVDHQTPQAAVLVHAQNRYATVPPTGD